MDESRFDALARFLGGPSPRRNALRIVGGGALGAMAGLIGFSETDAGGKNKKKKKKKKRCPKGRVKCGGGKCAKPGECCPGEKQCGGGCIAGSSCCPYFERACPNKRCVPLKDGCCDDAECGGCGTCINGQCFELPGICDSEQCEQCDFASGSCKSKCTGMFGTCCNGACRLTELGPWEECGSTCCQGGKVCCTSGDLSICCNPGEICPSPCTVGIPIACCTQAAYTSGHCCSGG
jgi:hypothetical protein